jgi:predicted CoA-binding protein
MSPTLSSFVESKCIAVVGVSRSGAGFGAYTLRSLRARGYRVFAVNAQADEAAGEPCFCSLSALPERPELVVAVVPPPESLKVVEACAEAGIGKVWLQQGAESDEAVARAKALGLELISKACVLMYLRPTGLHALHGWFSAREPCAA